MSKKELLKALKLLFDNFCLDRNEYFRIEQRIIAKKKARTKKK